jgi:hypothetical protein
LLLVVVIAKGREVANMAAVVVAVCLLVQLQLQHKTIQLLLVVVRQTLQA